MEFAEIVHVALNLTELPHVVGLNLTEIVHFNRNTIFDGNIYNRFLITVILLKIRLFKK